MLQFANTTLLTITDSASGQVRNDFRIGVAEYEVLEAGSFTITIPETAVLLSAKTIWPDVEIASGERVQFYVSATYGVADNTWVKRELLLIPDSITDPIKVDGQFGGSFTAQASATVARSATASAPCTLQVFWVKLAN